MTLPDDAQVIDLIDELRLGSDIARTWLYKRLWKPAVALVRAFVAEDLAEDVAQTALIQILGPLPAGKAPAILSYDRSKPFRRWFVGVLSKRAIDRLREEGSRRNRETIVAERQAGRYAPRDTTAQLVIMRDLVRALKEYRAERLSAEQNELIELWLSRIPGPEIASVFDVPVGTIYRRIHYLIKAMKEHFDGDA